MAKNSHAFLAESIAIALIRLGRMTPSILLDFQMAEATVIHKYSVSIVTQGRHRFHTLTMPSDVLAKTCFVTTRDEDPVEGFQRVLDTERAQAIADYIDTGLGTIPSAIVLSAQPEAEYKIIRRGGSVEFKGLPKAFLILDGQHRVYGFSLAKTRLRVPVVIYNGLSRVEEARLFIDINTKQRPVSNELLLDIKKLAEYESDSEHLFGEVFDTFNSNGDSPLLGLMSATERAKGKISRVTFNAALKQILSAFESAPASTVYEVFRDYLKAFTDGLSSVGADGAITNPIVFRAVTLLFPEVAQRVADKYNGAFSPEHFAIVLKPIFAKAKSSTFVKPVRSYRELKDSLSQFLRQQFTLTGKG